VKTASCTKIKIQLRTTLIKEAKVQEQLKITYNNVFITFTEVQQKLLIITGK